MRTFFLLLITLVCSTAIAQKHSVLGKWKSIDDETGKELERTEDFGDVELPPEMTVIQ